MEQILSIPSFGIPSICTPLHQPEEDQQILHLTQQRHRMQMSPLLHPVLQPNMSTGPQSCIYTDDTSMEFTTPQSMMQPHMMSPVIQQHISSHQPPTNLGPTSQCPTAPTAPSSDCHGIVPQLQNIVSTVNLGCKLDLKKIALHARNAEYNPKRFAAVIMRIREPRTTALIFSSGKMVCTGAKSEMDSRLAARKYARIIQKLGFPAKFLDFEIQNMVGSCDVKFPIRLEGLFLTHQVFSSYEPELFPGLIYKMLKPKIVLLVFVSGKVVLTGARVKNDINEAFNNIYPILKSFKKQ